MSVVFWTLAGIAKTRLNMGSVCYIISGFDHVDLFCAASSRASVFLNSALNGSHVLDIVVRNGV